VASASLRVFTYRVLTGVIYRLAWKRGLMENGFSDRTRQPMRWLLRKLARGLPPLPTIGGRALATRVAGLLLLGGAILISVTVALPPAARGSDVLILGYGAVAGVTGALLLTRRRVEEPILGLAAALGTVVITLATVEGGPARGTADNEVLFLWVSLFSFWFLSIRHALLQLGLIGLAEVALLIDDDPGLAAGITRWVVTITTLLVSGLLMAWIRRSLEREREETARLAVVAERMRIARDLHDAAGHGVTAVSLQAAAGLRALEEDDTEEAHTLLEEIKRTSRAALEDMRKLLGLLRPGDARDRGGGRVSLSHLDEMIDEVRAAGLTVSLERSGEAANLPPVLDQTAYRIVQESLTNVLKHAGSGAAASVSVSIDPASVELEVTDDGPGTVGSVAVGTRSGLIGMRERVELFGGRFSAGPREGGGFRVFARLPVGDPLENFSTTG
jgi:signal transduction histidine kinase